MYTWRKTMKSFTVSTKCRVTIAIPPRGTLRYRSSVYSASNEVHVLIQLQRRNDFVTGGTAVCKPEGVSAAATTISTSRVKLFSFGAFLSRGWVNGREFVSKQIKISDG
jgi:hypothetical protein